MRIVCIGGGPAGLYFGLLMKKENPGPPRHGGRAQPALRHLRLGRRVLRCDHGQYARLGYRDRASDRDAFNHWDDIEVLIKGRRMRTTGHGFVGIGRKKLLNILQARCEELGVELVFEREVDSDLEFPDADLIIASDGINSKIRNRYQNAFKPDMVMRPNRFIWLGTEKSLRRFHLRFPPHRARLVPGPHLQVRRRHLDLHRRDDGGRVQRRTASTRPTRRARSPSARSCSAKSSTARSLMSNARHLRGSAWLNFGRLICGKWSHFNGRNHVVLMGDAVHTAHFAIGSGTKLALEDAIELTRQFRKFGATPDKIPEVLAAYEEVRAVDVARIQNAARNAMEWFEVVGSRYADTLEPEQFMYSLLTRSQRISHENLRLRDKAWLEGYERWFAARAGINIDPDGPPVPPMFTPYRVRGADAAEPHRHVADGDVFRRRRRAERLSSRAFRQPRARWRRHDIRRDDLRVAGCAHHARLPRPLERRAGGGLEAHRRLRPHDDLGEIRSATRPCRAARARPAWHGRASISRSMTATGR